MRNRVIKDASYYEREHVLDAVLTGARDDRASESIRDDTRRVFAMPAGPLPPAAPTSYACVEPVPQEWVWPGLIPAGRLTLVAGPGGTRKGFWATDLLARVTRGDVMGDGLPGPLQGSVIAVTLEDDPNTAMAYRLRAAKADLTRVHDLTAPGGVPFLLPDNIDDLSALAVELGDVRLIYIDPLSAATSVALQSNVTVRRNVTNPLEALAADTGAAVVLMHHTVKSGQIAGSKGLVDACRSVLRISVDKARPDVRLVELEKSNLAAEQTDPVRFTTVGEWPDIAVRYLPDTGTTDDTEAAVLAVLRAAGPMDAQQISARIATSCKVVMIALMKLAKTGAVYVPERGLYAAVS